MCKNLEPTETSYLSITYQLMRKTVMLRLHGGSIKELNYVHLVTYICSLNPSYKLSSNLPTYICTCLYSTTYHSRAIECLQNIRGTDFSMFIFILFPPMSNILLLKSVSIIVLSTQSHSLLSFKSPMSSLTD